MGKKLLPPAKYAARSRREERMNLVPRIDFPSLMEPVALRLLGAPNLRLSKSPKDVRFGNHGSMAVDYENGRWFDHENQDGGGVLDLIARKTGRQGREALEWLKEEGIYRATSEKGSPSPRSRPMPVSAIGKIVATYDYPDEDGKLIFQVVRFDPKDFRQRRPAQPDDDPSKVRDGWVWEVRGLRQVPYRLP
jgi:hypothetical protein